MTATGGIFVTLTVDTTGIGFGEHLLSITTGSAIEDGSGSEHHFTGQNFTSNIQGNGLIIMDGPEPSSMVLGPSGLAGFGVVAIRTRRARRS